ncbi:hypothetical protein ABZP36_006885 [Zizania latifolia]
MLFGMVFSRSDPVRSPYYNIALKEIHVAKRAVWFDSRKYDSKHGTVLERGTTYAHLPEQAIVAFLDAVTSKVYFLKNIGGPDSIYKDLCLASAGRGDFDVDNFVEVLLKDVEWLLRSPEAIGGSYVFVCCHASRDKRCNVCGPVLIKRFKEERWTC